MYVDILILACLRAEPAHGYEIKKRVERIIGGDVPLNNNLLYPALKRFEGAGAVVREDGPGRPDRRVYRLTDRGDTTLHELLRAFTPDLARDEAEFLTRVASFHLLDGPARLRILRTREVALQGRLAHYEGLLQEAERAAHPGGPGVLQFKTRHIHQELAWIATLIDQTTEDPA